MSLSLKEQLDAVASAFSSHLEEKLQQFESIWQIIASEACLNKDALQSLSDIVHELQGQGALFGYPEVTQCASILEDIIDTMINARAAISPNARSEIAGYLHQLKDAATQRNELRGAFFDDPSTITAIVNFKKAATRGSQPKRVLLIEDAKLMRAHIAIALRQAGFEVLEAAGGVSGIELACATTPDLILLDIKMPEVDGFQVQKIIRTHEALADVPLIFLTSLSRVTIAQIQEALSSGVTDFITKPFKMNKLLAKVKQNLQ